MYDWIGRITANQGMLHFMTLWMQRIPHFVMYRFCRFIGFCFYYYTGNKLRGRVRQNMEDLLIEKTKKQIRRLSYEYFCNMVICLYEIMIGSKSLPDQGMKRFLVSGEHHLQAALQAGNGAIVYLPHLGNFFFYYWYVSQKYDCLAVATAESPELRPIYLQFQQLGCKGLDYDRTPPLELMRALRKQLANNGVVFILGDFWRPSFPLTQFFGRTTRAPQGAIALALEQKAPIIPFSGKVIKGLRHQLSFEEPIHLCETFERTQRDQAALKMNRWIEQIVRETPEQWFYWFNVQERWERQ